jgi:hypothetical protein
MQRQATGGDHGPGRPVLIFDEADYRFGTGPLRLVVTRVHWNAPQRDGAEVWYEVQGIEMTGDGREVGARTALVRASRLRGLPTTSGRYLGP